MYGAIAAGLCYLLVWCNSLGHFQQVLHVTRQASGHRAWLRSVYGLRQTSCLHADYNVIIAHMH